jgi:hypothetical protein
MCITKPMMKKKFLNLNKARKEVVLKFFKGYSILVITMANNNLCQLQQLVSNIKA